MIKFILKILNLLKLFLFEIRYSYNVFMFGNLFKEMFFFDVFKKIKDIKKKSFIQQV